MLRCPGQTCCCQSLAHGSATAHNPAAAHIQLLMPMQNKVADVLHSLGVPFAEEYAPRANFFNVDIASKPAQF